MDGVPIAWDSPIRHYHGRHAGHVAEALEQLLFLPKDMESYKNFSQQELFLSLKRDPGYDKWFDLLPYLNTWLFS